MPSATLKDVRVYLGCTLQEIKELTPEDREELKTSLDLVNASA